MISKDINLDLISIDISAIKVKITMEDNVYECVVNGPQGKEYMLCHHWRELRTFFGVICNYRCENCGKQLNKKEFLAKNYHLYDHIERF